MNTKQKDKITNTSTLKKSKTKRAAPSTDPECLYSYRTIPVSLAKVERMAGELLEWPIKNPNAKTISEFYLSQGLKKETYNRLVNRHEVLHEAHEITMRRLGERLWGNAVDNKANWTATHFMLHNYADEYKEANEYWKDLKKAERAEEEKKDIVINIRELKANDELKKE